MPGYRERRLAHIKRDVLNFTIPVVLKNFIDYFNSGLFKKFLQ